MINKVLVFIFLLFSFLNGYSQIDWEKDIQLNFDTLNSFQINLHIDHFTRGVNIYNDNNQIEVIDSIMISPKDVEFTFSRNKLYICYSDSLKKMIYMDDDTVTFVNEKYKYISRYSETSAYGGNNYSNLFSFVEDIWCFIMNSKNYWDNPIYKKDTVFNNKEYSIFVNEIIADTSFGEYNLIGYFPQNFIVAYYIDKSTKSVDKIVRQQTNFSEEYLGYGDYRTEYYINSIDKNIKIDSYFDRDFISNSPKYKNYILETEGDSASINNDLAKNTVSWKDSVFNEWKSRDTKLSTNDLNEEFTGFDNRKVKLKDIKGWILIDSWHSRCGGCYYFMEILNDRISDFNKRGVKIMSVNDVEKESSFIKQYVIKQGTKTDNLYFTKSRKLFCEIYPAIMLISPDKKIVYKNDASELIIDDLLIDIDKIINEYEMSN